MNATEENTMTAKDLQILDLLAYHLYENDPDSSSRDYTTDWQQTPQIRQSYRARAQLLIEALQDSGVAVKPMKSKKFEEAVEKLRTIPARVAYDDSEIGVDSTVVA